MIAIIIAMVKLIGENVDEFAALLGHEAAHWAKGHVDASKTRVKHDSRNRHCGRSRSARGRHSGCRRDHRTGRRFGRSFHSRDDEREADATSIDYMLANGFDPEAAVRLQEKMLLAAGRAKGTFLDHPSKRAGEGRES